MKLHIKKGDTVKIISGNDKGKIAKARRSKARFAKAKKYKRPIC